MIIPNYNRADLIGITLENMLSQTLKPTEIIVVDDGSTDNSVEVIRSFGSKITLICQTNQGPGAARNAGLKVATGDYIQFFDSDDLCSLNKIECQVKALEASSADIAYSPWAKVYIESQQVRFENHVVQQRQLPLSKNSIIWFLQTWNILFQACIIRRSFVKKVGYYRTDLMPSEDSEFLFRLLLHNPKLEFVPDCLVLYRLHSMGQITASGTSQNHRILDWNSFLNIIEAQLKNNHLQVDLFTKLIFEAGMYQSLKYLSNLPDISQDIAKKKRSHYSPLSKKIYETLNLYRRIEAGLRVRLTGSAYLHPYQAFYPTEYQYQLIRDMGYEPVGSEPLRS
ncbi:MAG: glycosyltransferase family A protein [Nostoc sp.]|uniref:glycosyltransferase family 2 protein n=1 Tax=Nostoc sp. TaxID=1180 RepID=UPI002FFAC020